MPSAQQMARLRTFLSNDMRSELLHGIGIEDSAETTPGATLDRIREYIRSRRNVALDRVKFEERRQEPEESFDDYYVALRKIAKNADLCLDCFDERLATRIMVGIDNQETRQDLLAMKPFPKLQTVVDFCRSKESARKNESTLSGARNISPQIAAVGQKPGPSQPTALPDIPGQYPYAPPFLPPTQAAHPGPSSILGIAQRQPLCPPNRQGPQRPPQPSQMRGPCGFCGLSAHPRQNCPASQQICNHCGKKGHFARVCRGKPVSDHMGENRHKITAIKINATSSESMENRAPTVSLSVYGRANNLLGFCQATPDSAAEATVADIATMKRLGISRLNLLPVSDSALVASNGGHISCIGVADLEFKLGEKLAKDKVYFCENAPGMLISWCTCKKLAILPESYPKPCYGVSKPENAQLTELRQCFPEIDNLPDHPSVEQIESVKRRLIAHFADVFDDSEQLRPMNCPPMQIHLKDGVVPYAIRTPRSIPLGWRDPVKSELDKLQAQGIIERIPDGDTTEWCHPLVCVPKPKSPGEPRVCIDFTKLNTHVVRPLHPFPPPKDADSQIPNGCRFFSTLDARKGYFQIALDTDSSHLTTFITPWGRYRFLRAPMGLSSTGDEFCKQGDRALEGISNIQKVVDDILAYDHTFRDHLSRMWQILSRCRSHSITLSVSKFQFAAPKVNFCGYQVEIRGISADPDKIRAISEFPEPTNISDLRSFFGLVNQLGQFSQSLSALASPMRSLLSPKSEFMWTKDHSIAFRDVKNAICHPPTLATFELGRDTRLYTDASKTNGLGFVLTQRHGNEWKLIECGSRFLSDAESRYATIELELLAVYWASQKCSMYLIGNPDYHVVVDNKPLVSILNDKSIQDISNPRMQLLKEKLTPFSFKALWIPGRENVFADLLSRSPISAPAAEDETLAKGINAVMTRAMAAVDGSSAGQGSPSDPVLQSVKYAGQSDPKYQMLLQAIKDDFNSCDKNDEYLRAFMKMRDELSVLNGLALLGNRIIIPNAMKRDVVGWLHSAHLGVEKTKNRARQCVYWPGINSDLENLIRGCETCQERLPSLCKEPLKTDPEPEWVFQEVATDLFSHAGRNYLVYIDRLSGWPVMCDYGRSVPDTHKVLTTLRRLFGDLGVPVKLRSDNGPQFASKEFKAFLSNWGVEHAPSSPRYPQSNGLAESAVKSMKLLVQKTTVNGNIDDDAFVKGLLEYRNSPRYDGASPAEILFGHSLKSHVPAHRELFLPKWKQISQFVDRRAAKKSIRESNYNRAAHELRPLKLHDIVLIQDAISKLWESRGEIVKLHGDRSYLIKLPSGRVFWRNRKFLRPAFPPEGGDQRDM